MATVLIITILASGCESAAPADSNSCSDYDCSLTCVSAGHLSDGVSQLFGNWITIETKKKED